MGILNSFFGSTLYIQLSPDRLEIRDPKSGKTFAEPPEVAITRVPKFKIVGIGAQARIHASDPLVEVMMELTPFHRHNLAS